MAMSTTLSSIYSREILNKTVILECQKEDLHDLVLDLV